MTWTVCEKCAKLHPVCMCVDGSSVWCVVCVCVCVSWGVWVYTSTSVCNVRKCVHVCAHMVKAQVLYAPVCYACCDKWSSARH